MDKKFDILTFGQLLLRLSPPSNHRLVRGESFSKQVGGAELNVAVGGSLLGLKTGIISKLPSHDIGQFIKNKIRSYGISDDYLLFDEDEDARVGIYFYENGAYPRKPKVIYDRESESFYNLKEEEFISSMYSNTRCFHTTGITLALSPILRQTTKDMIQKFKEAGSLISFDVNFRGNLWTGEEAKKSIEEILPYIDIFFCSEDTARLTFGKKGDIYEMMKSFAKEYPIRIMASTKRVVNSPKSHDFGSVVYDAKKDEFFSEEPYKNIDVVDRIGSGDSYISGALYGLLTSDMDIKRACIYGNAVSALKNTVPGDVPQSDLSEIESIIADHNNKGFISEMKR